MTEKSSHHGNQGVRAWNVTMQRGKGKISILQPGMGDPDWVDEAWLKEHQNALPPGTVVMLADGRKFTSKG